MRYFIALAILIMVLPVSAAAQTAISEEMANAYYENCKNRPDPRMKPETQDALCACTSVMMMEHMSVEDVQTMKGNDQAGRNALNKMMLEVYAPCMNYPVQDLVGSQCMENPQIARTAGVSKKALCECMAKKTATWFTDEGRALIARVIRENPNVYDPIGPVMESSTFKSKSYSHMMACMSGR